MCRPGSQSRWEEKAEQRAPLTPQLYVPCGQAEEVPTLDANGSAQLLLGARTGPRAGPGEDDLPHPAPACLPPGPGCRSPRAPSPWAGLRKRLAPERRSICGLPPLSPPRSAPSSGEPGGGGSAIKQVLSAAGAVSSSRLRDRGPAAWPRRPGGSEPRRQPPASSCRPPGQLVPRPGPASERLRAAGARHHVGRAAASARRRPSRLQGG